MFLIMAEEEEQAFFHEVRLKKRDYATKADFSVSQNEAEEDPSGTKADFSHKVRLFGRGMQPKQTFLTK